MALANIPSRSRHGEMTSRPSNPSGLNGAVPTAYDPIWKTYTDLTRDQIDAFTAFPQDLTAYAAYHRHSMIIAKVTQATVQADAVTAVNNAYGIEATVLAGITGKTVTNRSQIDAAFAGK